MSQSLLRLPGVIARTGLSKSALYQRMQAGTFLRPITIPGSRVKAWPSDAIDKWVDAAVAEARATEEA